MQRFRSRLIAWMLTGVWTALALVLVGVWSFLHGEPRSLAYQVMVVLTGLITGLGSGLILSQLLHYGGTLRVGGLAGHVLLAPSAVQLGLFAASFAAKEVMTYHPNGYLAMAAYGSGFCLAAVLVLTIGSAVGMCVQLACRAAGANLFPQWTSRPGSGWRPSWKSVRISMLSLALLGTAVYADREVILPWPEVKPPVVSEWIERDKSLFRGLLAGHRYDILVLPVETDGPSFDRIERSMMTRYLSQRTAERTGQRLPDPTLLARALDVRARRIEHDDALRLAESMGVRTVLASKVRRDGRSFTTTSRLWSRQSDGAPWTERTGAALANLSFDDQSPPSFAFRDAVDSLLDQLKLGAALPAPAPPSPIAEEAKPPVDLLRLSSQDGGSATERALRLQLLASLHQQGTVEAETLWERSLVALWRTDDASELGRILEARAYARLARRPCALERLGVPKSPAGLALLAALNGDVPGIEAVIESIGHPGLRLITETELADLYEAYGLDKRLAARRKTLSRLALTDVEPLDFRLSGPDWFRGDVHGKVASALTPVTIVELAWHQQADAWFRWLNWLPDPLGASDLRLALAVERHYGSLWKEKAAEWTVRRATDQTADWDYYELLFAMNRRAMLKTVRSTLHQQGLPKQAIALIESLGDVFSGYPPLVRDHAYALDKIGQTAPRGVQHKLNSESSALALGVYRWEGGESPIAHVAEQFIFERSFDKYLDEPPRAYRTEFSRSRLQFGRTSVSPQEAERQIADATRRLAYVEGDPGKLRVLVSWLRRAGQVEEALKTVQANRHRFVGTLGRAELIDEVRETVRRGEDPVPIYRVLLDLDPDNWDAHRRLARAYLESGRPLKAQEVYLSFPGFADHEGQNIVALSNRAFEAGFYFYRLGEPRIGEPLFRVANRLRTWSRREVHARELVAVIESDLRRASEQALYQVDRYDDSRAGMRLVMYHYLLGMQDQAWSRFFDFVNRFGDEEPWTAAFVAHRMQGLQGPELERWLAQAKLRDTRRDYLSNALRERHAFMLALHDRAPSNDAVALIRNVARANNDSGYYVQLAEGYVALREGDFAKAAQKLRGPHNDLFNLSIERRHSLSEWLPFIALAHARLGQTKEADKLMADHLGNIGVDSDYLVARGLLDGMAGKHDAAAQSLRLAFHRLTVARTRAFFPGYLLLEACEMLLIDSKNDVYRALIEDFARRLQVEVPHAWAAAFEAKYARDPVSRKLAIAAANILDPKSLRLGQVAEPERQVPRDAAFSHDSLLGASLRRPTERVAK